MHLNHPVSILFVFFTIARGYLYAENLGYMNDTTFMAARMQPTHVVKENGPLGYLPFFLVKTGMLSNIVSLIHTLGDNLENYGVEGFNALFKRLGVEIEGGSSRVCIGDFLVYNCRDRRFIHKHDSGRLFTDTIIEILREGYRDFFQVSGQEKSVENPARDTTSAQSQIEGNFYTNPRTIDLVDRLINSRYFLLQIYLYTTHIKSEEGLKILYDNIFSKMCEAGCDNDGILYKCFLVKEWAEKNTKNTPDPLALLASRGKYLEKARFSSTNPSNGRWKAKVDGHAISCWAEGCIYALARCLCIGFKIEARDFINEGDKDLQEFLQHAIDIGYVSEFDSLFKKKCARLLRERINKNGCFPVKYKENLEAEPGLINILGILGNFFVKFLNELGVEGKSISGLKTEYEELLRVSGLPNKDPKDIIGKFTGLITKMVRSLGSETLSYRRRGSWMDDSYSIMWERIDVDFTGLRFSKLNEFIGNIAFSFHTTAPSRFTITCKGQSNWAGIHYPSKISIEVLNTPFPDVAKPASTGIQILDIFAETYRQKLKQLITPRNYQDGWGFESTPIAMLIRGDLTIYKHIGYSLLSTLFKDPNVATKTKYSILHHSIISMILKNFDIDNYDGLNPEFLRNIENFIKNISASDADVSSSKTQ